MCFTYDVTCDVYSEQIRVARKRHVCDGCQTPIPPGDRYVNGKGVADGHGFSLHHCGICEVMRQRIHEHEIAEGCHWNESWIAPEDIAEWVSDEEVKTGTDYSWPTVFDGQTFLVAKAVASR